jgi:general secretion pathway protein E
MGDIDFGPILASARGRALVSGRALVAELADAMTVPAREALQALAKNFGLEVMETRDMAVLTLASDVLPLAQAIERCALLLRGRDAIIAVVADPFDSEVLTWLEARAGCALSLRIALDSDIRAYLSRFEESVRALDDIGQGDGAQGSNRIAPVLSISTVGQSASPAVRLVDSTLYDALKATASDIHIESTPVGLAIKYRVDGVLDSVKTVNGSELASQVVSRLKVLAELDIAERRVPQDGSFRIESAGREIDLRLSIMPSIHGEDAVIRILDKRAMIEAHGALTLDALGLDDPLLSQLRELAADAYGMLLVTGPTGSGKTTTLYAALTETNTGHDKIITIEDPVEYQLPGVLQIPVNEKKGLSFAKGLRSILRHDPDKIMVGEIRDRETAEIAVQSALTGHLVLTTVHANNAFDVFGRFAHMGIDPYAFVSALNGVWAQRLVRVNCPHCSADYTPSDAELARVQLSRIQVRDFRFRQGAGCGDCRGSGYKGRRLIAEVLVLNDEIRELVLARAPIRQIKEAAKRNGTRSLRDAGLDQVAAGNTTLADIARVTHHA